jgi:hypothetical protein
MDGSLFLVYKIELNREFWLENIPAENPGLIGVVDDGFLYLSEQFGELCFFIL